MQVVELLVTHGFEHEELLKKLKVVQKAFHLLNDYIIPGFAFPPEQEKLESVCLPVTSDLNILIIS